MVSTAGWDQQQEHHWGLAKMPSTGHWNSRIRTHGAVLTPPKNFKLSSGNPWEASAEFGNTWTQGTWIEPLHIPKSPFLCLHIGHHEGRCSVPDTCSSIRLLIVIMYLFAYFGFCSSFTVTLFQQIKIWQKKRPGFAKDRKIRFSWCDGCWLLHRQPLEHWWKKLWVGFDRICHESINTNAINTHWCLCLLMHDFTSELREHKSQDILKIHMTNNIVYSIT